MFKRLHDKNLYDGTGVGLSICARITEKHGGTIEALSAPDQGTTIEIVLPALAHPTA